MNGFKRVQTDRNDRLGINHNRNIDSANKYKQQITFASLNKHLITSAL